MGGGAAPDLACGACTLGWSKVREIQPRLVLISPESLFFLAGKIFLPSSPSIPTHKPASSKFPFRIFIRTRTSGPHISRPHGKLWDKQACKKKELFSRWTVNSWISGCSGVGETALRFRALTALTELGSSLSPSPRGADTLLSSSLRGWRTLRLNSIIQGTC